MKLYRTVIPLYLYIDKENPLHETTDIAPEGTLVSTFKRDVDGLLCMKCEKGPWVDRTVCIMPGWVNEISALERLAMEAE